MHILCTSTSKAYLTFLEKLPPLAAVHQNCPSVSREESSHRFFKYSTNGYPISHHTNIRILVTASPVAESPRTWSLYYLFEAKNHAKPFNLWHTFRQEHAYTFVFVDEPDGSISAWCFALQRHPIHLTQYHASL